MDPFEDIIISVLNNYIKENKCTELSSSDCEIKVSKSSGQILTISVLLADSQSINAELHFSDWAIRSSITTQAISNKVALQFCQLIESLTPSFCIVYKNVKW